MYRLLIACGRYALILPLALLALLSPHYRVTVAIADLIERLAA